MTSLLSFLSDLGAASLSAFWLPILAWTALALAAEAALRASGAASRIGLATRGSLVVLLPLGLVAPPLLARWVPSVHPTSVPLATVPVTSPLHPAAPLAPEAVPSAMPLLPAVSPEAAPTDWASLVLGGATASAVVLGVLALVVLAGGLLWIARYRQRLQAAAQPVREEAAGLSRRMGVRRRVHVATVDDTVSPFTVGLWRPLVALPSGLAPEARRLVLTHELAHVRDAHFGWAICERVVRAAFVWHPLVHVLGRGLALDREREADAAVLSLWPDRAAEYGQLLHSLSTRPSPRFALGASTSPLLSRLHAMTRSTPERRRLARLTGAMLLVLPLLASAALLPDAAAQQRPAAPQTPSSQPLLASAAPLAPEAPPEAPEVPGELETVLPPAPEAVRADTLMQYMAQRQVWNRDGRLRVQLKLTADATYEIAQTIADYYSDGDEEGELLIVGSGFQIQRSTLRKDAIPPPPPPPAAAPRAPQTPEPPPPPPPSASDADLARYADVLSADLAAAQEAYSNMEAPDLIQKGETYIRLKTRLETVRHEYQRLIEEQERRRLDAMRTEALGGEYH